METIKLHNKEGIARLSGEDEHGNKWIQFEVDYLAEQVDGECSICGAVLSSGWMCLDGGEEVCEEHITFKERVVIEPGLVKGIDGKTYYNPMRIIAE